MATHAGVGNFVASHRRALPVLGRVAPIVRDMITAVSVKVSLDALPAVGLVGEWRASGG